MPLVINSLGGGDTHAHAHAHAHAHTHTRARAHAYRHSRTEAILRNQARASRRRAPGLKLQSVAIILSDR